jgi:hypothetical protein
VRFRFTIRDMLWLTVVVAMAIAWRLDRSRWQQDWNAAHTGIIQEFNELKAKMAACEARERTAGIWPQPAPK